MPFAEDPLTPPEAANPKGSPAALRLKTWLHRMPWFSLPLIGLLLYLLLRLLAQVAVHPAWASGFAALAMTAILIAAKSWSLGAEASRQTINESWQKLSDWLAVTSWWRLVVVSLCLLVAAAVSSDALSDHLDLASLVIGLFFALVALKLARPGERAVPDWRNGLSRITWPRLILVGLLALLAGAIANDLFNTSEHHKAQVNTTISSTDDEDDEAPAVPEPPTPEASSSSVSASAPVSSSEKGTDVKLGASGIDIIERDPDGKIKKHVQIGQDGIRINKGTEGSSVEIKTPGLAQIPGLPPEKAREIESRIREKIAAKVADASDEDGDKGFNFASLIFLALVSLSIMKLLAGGKHRAEQDAGSARLAADLARLEREAADAKLHAMQAQIEPHFLFNTLASIDQLIRTDPQRASQVQKTLIQYLRAAIPQMRDDAQRSTLGRQVSMSHAYLEIMQVRMEERLAFSFDVPEGILCAEFPSMMLQTLIENSIKHGLEPKTEGGRIDVSAEVARGKLRVRVVDTGAGCAADARDGVGLSNIRERLRLLYGDSATLTLSANETGGTIAVIEIPYHDDEGQQAKTC